MIISVFSDLTVRKAGVYAVAMAMHAAVLIATSHQVNSSPHVVVSYMANILIIRGCIQRTISRSLYLCTYTEKLSNHEKHFFFLFVLRAKTLTEATVCQK